MSKVYLVGAGPGDPELITWKGRRLIQKADSILYDNLAARSLLDLARPEAERVYVGKKRAEHEHTQEEICAMLVERARRGWNVVRLKGGDPFIFGRGGEEAEALADAGIAFEVVPGVTTPLGIAAYTGVPLTHRDHTSVVAFVTGHNVAAIDWDRVSAAETLVLFMGLMNLEEIARQIIACGRCSHTPAMAVRWATRADQQTIAGTLGTLPAMVREAGMRPPATVVIGEVVRLRGKLDWFERLPLFGKRIVVTRAAAQSESLLNKLHAFGADAVALPTIEIAPAQDFAPLDAAIARLEVYDWLLFTSVNGVRRFLERLDRSGRDLRDLPKNLAAIGPATRGALEELHLKVDLIATEYVAEGLLRAFGSHPLEGRRILLPRAAVARDTAPQGLRARGAIVDVVEAYRTVIPNDAAERGAAIFNEKPPDWITFTSSSTVRNFAEAVGTDCLRDVRVASIGPVTSAAAREFGITVAAEAQPYTEDGLVQSIVSSV